MFFCESERRGLFQENYFRLCQSTSGIDLWGDDAAFCQITLTSCLVKTVTSAVSIKKSQEEDNKISTDIERHCQLDGYNALTGYKSRNVLLLVKTGTGCRNGTMDFKIAKQHKNVSNARPIRTSESLHLVR